MGSFIKLFKKIFFVYLFLALLLINFASLAQPKSKVKHPEWSNNSTIYELNIRQFSKEGTFKAVQKDVPRLKDLGVEIVWFMPIHPIGEKNRKGSLGSYYAVKDYKAVNPEFGTMQDFKDLVNEFHKHDIKVIIDWVANHTSPDNVWVEKYPDFYTKDSLGNLIPPVADWSDVADLNFDNKKLWKEMQDALKFWVKEANIDGYRCDVAGMVPIEFWNETRKQLDKIKPVFMLAEDQAVEMHFKAFDMTYSWDLHHMMNEVARGEKNVSDIENYFAKKDAEFPASAIKMNFITNHDENSWNGSEFERMREMRTVKAFAVLNHTVEGMPLIYNGQEAALAKRLSFFEKDSISWGDYKMQDFYSTLVNLKTENKALWNGLEGGEMVKINSDKEKEIFAFTREKGNDKILVVMNLSSKEQDVNLNGKNLQGSYKEVFTNENKTFSEKENLKLDPWAYKVFVK